MLDHGCIGGPDPLQEMDFLESPTAQGFGREIGQQNINSQVNNWHYNILLTQSHLKVRE